MEMRCSFCGKTKDEVEAIVQGDDGSKAVFICSECVAKFIPIVREPTGGSAA